MVCLGNMCMATLHKGDKRCNNNNNNNNNKLQLGYHPVAVFILHAHIWGKKVTRKFKSGGLHEKHVVATWKLGNHLSIRLQTQGNQEKPVSRWPVAGPSGYWLLASSPASKVRIRHLNNYSFVISEDCWRLFAIPTRRRLENECTKFFIDLTLRNTET